MRGNTRSDVQKCECGLNGADGSSGLLNPSVLLVSPDDAGGFYADEKGHEAPEEEKPTHKNFSLNGFYLETDQVGREVICNRTDALQHPCA